MSYVTGLACMRFGRVCLHNTTPADAGISAHERPITWNSLLVEIITVGLVREIADKVRAIWAVKYIVVVVVAAECRIATATVTRQLWSATEVQPCRSYFGTYQSRTVG
jgi:hypothetical protein